MYFNVSQIMKAPTGTTRSYQVDESITPTDESPSVRVLGTAKMLRTDQGIWVSAKLDTEVACSCSRCLAEINYPIQLTIEEEYLPSVDVASGASVHQPEDPSEGFFIDQKHTLDLSEAVRQYRVLGTPMSPVCRSNCRGICPSCGTNFNFESCTCDNMQTDSRWSKLLEHAAASGLESEASD